MTSTNACEQFVKTILECPNSSASFGGKYSKYLHTPKRFTVSEPRASKQSEDPCRGKRWVIKSKDRKRLKTPMHRDISSMFLHFNSRRSLSSTRSGSGNTNGLIKFHYTSSPVRHCPRIIQIHFLKNPFSL